MSATADEAMQPLVPFIDGSSRIFGVIAHPAKHIRAPMVFNPLFAAAKLRHVMVPIEAPPESLETIVRGLQRIPNFGGLAVTIPHKIAMAELCDQLSGVAQLTGAVNAVRFDADGGLYGDNFDGAGFVTGCLENGHEIVNKNILILGAGGAARAIAAAVCDIGVGRLVIANRHFQKAQNLVELLINQGGFKNVVAQALADTDGSYANMIINCTSLGLHPDDSLPIKFQKVSAGTVIADIIMMPAKTKWLQAAATAGLPIHYGHHMLDHQVELIGKFIGAL